MVPVPPCQVMPGVPTPAAPGTHPTCAPAHAREVMTLTCALGPHRRNPRHPAHLDTCTTAATPPRTRHLHAHSPTPQLPPCLAARAQTHRRRRAGGAHGSAPLPPPDAHLEPPTPLRTHRCLPLVWHAPCLCTHLASHMATHTHPSWHAGGQRPPPQITPTNDDTPKPALHPEAAAPSTCTYVLPTPPPQGPHMQPDIPPMTLPRADGTLKGHHPVLGTTSHPELCQTWLRRAATHLSPVPQFPQQEGTDSSIPMG